MVAITGNSSVGNPYFGIEYKVIVIPCQSRDFPLSYAVIAIIVHLLFHYFLSFIIFNILIVFFLVSSFISFYR